MAIKFSCSCGKTLQVPDSAAGKKAACPQCKAQVRVPMPTDIEADEAPIVVVPVVSPITAEPPPVVKPAWDTEDDDEEKDKDDSEEEEQVEAAYYGPANGKPKFFRDAPDEIGAVHVGFTSLAKHVKPRGFFGRFAWAFVISGFLIGGLCVGGVILQIFAKNPMHPLALFGLWAFLSLIVIALCFGIAYEATGFAHFCGYVGVKGCAYYTCKGQLTNVKRQVLVFDDAATLRIQSTHFFMNGGYTHTNYEYKWTDEDGRELLTISDSHNAHNNPVPDGSSYHLAEAAEHAWSMYLLDKILPILKDGGKYKFELSGDNYLMIREDSLVLMLNGKKQTFEPEDIAEMRIESGTIALKEPGASKGWFTESGYHYFTFAELSNARVFLLLMHNLFEVPIT